MIPNPHSTDNHGGEGHQIDRAVNIEDIHLYPEEEITRVEKVHIRKPSTPLPVLEALSLLAGVKDPRNIGTKGPVMAAMAFPEDKDVIALHLYEVLFGRDSLISATFVLDQYPALARSTIIALASLQGVIRNEASEEEPGKILHEHRQLNDPIAIELTRRRGWQWPYYGSVDATPRFLNLLAAYITQHEPTFLQTTVKMKDGTERSMLQVCQAAISWVKKKIDANNEGFLESLQINTIGGNAIQSWKDSVDSHHHSDGSLANRHRGIASIEVQALAYDCLLNAAKVFEMARSQGMTLGHESLEREIAELKGVAQKLKDRIITTFWLEDSHGGYFALGSDRSETGALRVLDVRTSNMGHILASQLLDKKEAKDQVMVQKLVKTLLSPLLSSPHGIRTLATNEKRYRPNNYHNGSIWPWDTYQISIGLLQHGYKQEAHAIWEKLLRIPQETGQYPEFISGNDTDQPILPSRIITVYDKEYKIERNIEQPPQQIQAWTVAAIAAIENSIKK